MKQVITSSSHYRDFSAAAMGGFVWAFGGVADGKHQRFLYFRKVPKWTSSFHVYKMDVDTLEWSEHSQRMEHARKRVTFYVFFWFIPS